MNTPARLSCSLLPTRFEQALAALLLLLASACHATGEYVDAVELTTLRPGQTTISEIHDALGPPKFDSVIPCSEGCERRFAYGPWNADYEVVVDSNGRLLRYARIQHTGCLTQDPGDPPIVMNEPIPLVDEVDVEHLRVGVTTHRDVVALLGACRRADKLDGGDYRIVWGPQEDDWVFVFHADGSLAGCPEHRVRPSVRNQLGVW